MDLNASPLPEEDEQPYEEHLGDGILEQPAYESSVQTLHRIACKGRDAVPDNESVNRFVYEVMQFIGRQKHSRKYVLVHCTHGHNRTGFMICHYLIRTKLCSVNDGKGTSQFPGSHPVSLNRVQLRFPSRVDFEGCYLHNFTLIDGEMIIDAVPDIGLKRRYLAYDLIALNNQSVVKLPFSERWKLLEEEVIRPRNSEKKIIEREGKVNLAYRYEMEPFGGWDDPYVPRTHEGLLKWKYPEMNSVDFLFEIGGEGNQLLYLYERGKKKLMDGSRVSFRDDDDVVELSGKIIECSWDQESRYWVCMRVRTDKSTPNDINTYRKVMRSINDNITEEVLLDEIAEIVRLPMYADRIEKAYQLQQRRGR
ncbi:hypothetical protein HPP92_000700 [Vanilla planifolia]|uniref:mRNA guanylyltransferase n=1 Tax=Vanilla planifolia TaxID=51239 RepID=A0A835SB82_VANPL|nr:hypothetical protein HPP92_000700 [Vanilla planifolia]